MQKLGQYGGLKNLLDGMIPGEIKERIQQGPPKVQRFHRHLRISFLEFFQSISRPSSFLASRFDLSLWMRIIPLGRT